MELTKNQFVMKALIEEMTRRRYNGERNLKPDIQTGIAALSAILPKRIYILATSPRIADDFGCTLKGRARSDVIHLCHEDYANAVLAGQENAHVVQLHTGMLNIDQSEIRKRIMRVIQARCRNAVIWHIGDWHA